ncbi:hypothetical protein A6J64_009890 [Yersinia enterocolitica]|nr:hypothetical protein A6J64_009890 [Yersinia enterocolitica]PNM20900.1 hypothetical protein A6J65_020075 [Yersinia enterocolitica]PNM22010.1 hypothetical protein A6J63_003680 [Yersinia enterocolitica]
MTTSNIYTKIHRDIAAWAVSAFVCLLICKAGGALIAAANPNDLELQVGSKRTHHDELTQVSDSGK